MRQNILFLVFILLIGISSKQIEAQRILHDDLNSFSTYTIWTHFIDSLESHGVMVYLTSDGYWDSLMRMDVLWINQIRNYTPEDRRKIINFSHIGGKIIDFASSDPFNRNLNRILEDTLWETTMSINDATWHGPIEYFFIFPPLTNNIGPYVYPDHGYFTLANPTWINCGVNSYPFFICDTIDYKPVAAISYPFISEGNCNSFILEITGTGWLELGYIWQESQYRIGLNLLFCSLGMPGYELEPCAVPEPFKIQVDSCPNCANAGDTVTLSGSNLWKGFNENYGGDIEIYIGDTVVIPIVYSNYTPNCSTLTNTWLKFICPVLPDGNYFIQLGHKAILFNGGEILIPCETYDIQVDSLTECVNPGQLLMITGINLFPEIIIHVGDILIRQINYGQDSTFIAFQIPAIEWDTYQIQLERDEIFYDAGEIVIPCESYEIQVDSMPTCSNLGDTIIINGENLYPEIIVHIADTVTLPLFYATDSTYLEFECPELSEGNYQIQLERGTYILDAGEIQIPCESPHDTCCTHPQPFSPNNDGINDYCKFEYPGMSEDNGIVSIFNLDNTLMREVRNGDVQYSCKGTIYWDGKDSEGNLVNNGVYIYLLKVGSKIVCNGTVYVVK